MNAVSEVIQSGNFTVSAYSFEGGEQIRKFESKLCKMTGARYAVAVNSGTAALECSLLAMGVGYGDMVLIPSLTFVATANAVRSVGAVPMFCDVDEFGQMSYSEAAKICKDMNVKAIIIVDLYGRVSYDIKLFKSLCPIVIEDSCQALGTPLAGRYGDVGCFSFYASKVCTTMGLGGAIITNDPETALGLKVMRNQGMVEGETQFAGRNLIMGECNAAFGCVQLDRLGSFVRTRRNNMTVLGFNENSNGYMATILSPQRDEMLQMFHDAGIGAATYYDMPIHHHPVYKDSCVTLPMTDRFSRDVLNIPVHPDVSAETLETAKYILSRYKYYYYS